MCPALCRWVGDDNASVRERGTEKVVLEGEACVEELISTPVRPLDPREQLINSGVP